MANRTKVAFGEKASIESAKQNGTIDAYDLLLLKNGEVAWIDKDSNTVFSTPRTQTDIVVNGVTGLGIDNGATISAGATIDDIVKMLVQKAIPATYTKPTLTLTNNGGQASGSIEAGTSVTPKLRASFTQKDAGAMENIVIKKDSVVVAEGDSSHLDYNGDEIVIGDETITFTASADYGDAPIKTNNLGNESIENRFEAGTVTSSGYSISGKRNLFYGTGVGSLPEITSDVVRGLNNKKLDPTQGYSFSISVAVGQQYIVIAYPDTLRDLNNVTYVEANDGGMAASFTKSEINVADARGGENGLTGYKVYTYVMAVPAAAAMTFNITI